MKFTQIRIGYVVLAVAVIGVVLGVKIYTSSYKTEHDGSITTTNKAVNSLCQHADYKLSRRKSLENANNTNEPKDVQIAVDKEAFNLDKGPNDDVWWARGERRLLLAVDVKTLKPDVVVAQDGSGTFRTIMDAVRVVPKTNMRPFVIFIKQGIYNEYVNIPEHVNNVTFVGEGPTKTRITGSISYNDELTTFKIATVGFENIAGPLRHQAVALRVSGDMAIFYNCAMDGYQDTLYAHSNRQFYRQCTITGTIDFIFGDVSAVFQCCKMIVRKPLDNQVCTVTAQGRKNHTSKGAFILQGCTITAEAAYMTTKPMPKSYLGRP
ncbi:hypothetical protein L1987_16863 [Smallanthus sonchifolius]|uniref:Uncharacterized protein n=1 Tax=Smallanthus sonchifolius TaxID=185202 RepID=A0ACB9IYR3_9ASTR|nr:hypothetical protein L1987_16863 [Smallanthus sonchifolius]